MSISLSVSEVRAIVLASHSDYAVVLDHSLWNASFTVNIKWSAFNVAYDKYMADPSSTFMELRDCLKDLRGAIRAFDAALASSASE